MITLAQLEKQLQSRPAANSICDTIVLYNYDEDNKKGELIPSEKIATLEITEDMFGHLPTLHIEFSDPGTIFNSGGLAPGMKVFVRLSPTNLENQDAIPAPYVEGVYIIQYFRYITGTEQATYTYTIDCVFGAFGFLNKIVTWPRNTTVNQIKQTDQTSKEVVTEVAAAGGLKTASDTSSTVTDPKALLYDDSMLWVNTNMTCEEFCKHVTSHAWVGAYDAPLYYIDRTGTLTYTTLKSMCDAAVKATYMETSLYNNQFKDDGTIDFYCRTYQDAMIEDYGYLNNEGGYNATTYVYNPYSITTLPIDEMSTITVKGATLNSARCYKFHNTERSDKNRADFIIGESNATPQAGDGRRFIANEIHFKQTHSHYDVAPLHNRNFIKGFFQVFAYLTINNNTQVNKDTQESQRVHLGDKVRIDFTTMRTQNSIQTGEYIVCGIVHTVTAHTSFTTMLQCVRDTLTKTKKLLSGTDSSTEK